MVNVNALASTLNLMPLRVTLSEGETFVPFETPKVAISVKPLGTVAGVQLLALFQSVLMGLDFHVALPALKWPVKARQRRMTNFVFIASIFHFRYGTTVRVRSFPSPPS